MADQEPVVMSRQRYDEFLRNYMQHADQARDLSQRYLKAKEAVLRIADDIECERPCSAWVDNLRNAFNETKP
jgi:hypothetical protein